MIFSLNLTKLRKQKGGSQEELAELCSVSRQAVTKCECGTSQPDLNKISLLAQIFDVSLDKLILEKQKASYVKTAMHYLIKLYP